jgi:hypothetical protein
MGGFQEPNAAGKGSPNLEAMQYNQEQITEQLINGQVSYVAKLSVTASATGGTTFTSVPVGAEIVDVTVHCTATNGSGSAKLTVGAGGADITDAITMATLDAVTRVGTINQTYKYVTADGVDVVTNGNDDRGELFVYYKK